VLDIFLVLEREREGILERETESKGVISGFFQDL